jgi:glycine betaine catabolism B
MPPVPTSVLAFATTVHVALVVLRRHRLPAGRFPWALLPSLAFCAAPWLFGSAAALVACLAGHLAWFVACEKLIPANHHEPTRSSIASRRGSSVAVPSSRDFVPASVLAVIDESPSIRTFRLVRPESFTFRAGQFLTVRVQVDGQPHVRCYSISSAPEATGYIEISVRRQGLVSSTLHATVRPGSSLDVKPPAGRFVYPGGEGRPLVLIAGGVGITPLISMLRHGVVADPGRPTTLLYSARGSRELAFRDELMSLARRHPHVRLVCTVTEPGADWSGRVGRLDGAFITECVPDATSAVFLMCGPHEMIRVLSEALIGRGVPESQVRFEVFQPAAAIGAAASPASTPDRVSLDLVLSRLRVEIPSDQTLLDAAESAGAEIPTLCRAGVCCTCRTRLVEGDASCTSDALDERDRQAGYVLPCVTWARSDCALEA